MKKENKKVCVEIFFRKTAEELEKIIDSYLKNNYFIQNSQVEFDCGTVEGVYVFVLDETLQEPIEPIELKITEHEEFGPFEEELPLIVDRSGDELVLTFESGRVERITKKPICRSKAIEKILKTFDEGISPKFKIKNYLMERERINLNSIGDYEIEYVLNDLYGYGYVVEEVEDEL